MFYIQMICSVCTPLPSICQIKQMVFKTIEQDWLMYVCVCEGRVFVKRSVCRDDWVCV